MFKQTNQKKIWNGFENILQKETLKSHDPRLTCSKQWQGLEKGKVNLL